MFYVIEYSLTSDTESAADETMFDTLPEAMDFFESIDLRSRWLTERDCRCYKPSMDKVSYVKEIMDEDFNILAHADYDSKAFAMEEADRDE